MQLKISVHNECCRKSNATEISVQACSASALSSERPICFSLNVAAWMHAAIQCCWYCADSSYLVARAVRAATSTPSFLPCRHCRAGPKQSCCSQQTSLDFKRGDTIVKFCFFVTEVAPVSLGSVCCFCFKGFKVNSASFIDGAPSPRNETTVWFLDQTVKFFFERPVDFAKDSFKELIKLKPDCCKEPRLRIN